MLQFFLFIDECAAVWLKGTPIIKYQSTAGELMGNYFSNQINLVNDLLESSSSVFLTTG